MLKYGFVVVLIIFICLTLTNCMGNSNSSEDKMNFLSSVTNDSENAKAESQFISTGKQYADSIPEWYVRNRVQVLSSLLARDIGKPYFFDFPAELAKAGVTVLTREIKSGDEEPWWPSKYGSVYSSAQKYIKGKNNLATAIIKQMHSLNMKAIIYYRHTEDSEMLAKHPDWACRDINGNISKSARGLALSLNSPYRNIIIERVKELAAYGADGFYFDYIQIPENGDFSEYAKEQYKKKYGTDLSVDFNSGKIIQYYNFRNETIYNFFADLKDTLSRAGYNPVLLISGNSWPSLSDLHMSSEFYKNFTLKSELEVPNRIFKRRVFTMPATVKQQIPSFYLNAFSFSFMRDNTLGPPNIWCPQIKSQHEAESIVAGLISLGCVAEVDINHNPKRSDIDNFISVLRWNKDYGAFFEKMKPFAIAGITISEKERNKFVEKPSEAWKQVIVPAYKAFETLYKIGVPVQLLSDAQLTQQNTQQLSVVYTDADFSSKSLIPSSKIRNYNSIKNDDSKFAKTISSPIFCQKGNEFVHVNYFKDDEGYIYIATAPDFNSVKKDFSQKSKMNLAYTKSLKYSSNNGIKIFIKNDFNTEKNLEDLVLKNYIKSFTSEDGYSIYELPKNNALGLYRFKSTYIRH